MCIRDRPWISNFDDDEINQSANDESQQVDEDNDSIASVESENEPTLSEAFTCFDTALKWMERQPECDHVQLLSIKRLRNLAARK